MARKTRFRSDFAFLVHHFASSGLSVRLNSQAILILHNLHVKKGRFCNCLLNKTALQIFTLWVKSINPKNGSWGRSFFTQSRREAENAEGNANLKRYRSCQN